VADERGGRGPAAHTLSDLNRWRHVPSKRQDVVAIPTIWLALLVSLHFHAAMLLFWLPRMPHLSPDVTEPGQVPPTLVTRLVTIPTPAAAPSPPPAPPSPPAPRVALTRPIPAPPKSASPPPPRVPPPLAPDALLPARPPVPTPPPVAAPTPQRPPAEPDLASYIEARRRARGDPTTTSAQGTAPNAPPAETEAERRNRIVAANLAPTEQPTFGYDPKTGGGLFQLKRIGYDDAEFYFTGWNKDIGRRAKQVIEVRKGNADDVRQAVVRKMIAIIQDEVKGDFVWVSGRMGRQIKMSARPEDTAVLEQFLMQEFFSGARDPR